MVQTITKSKTYQVSCEQCSISGLCLPVRLGESDIKQLDTIVERGKPLEKNSLLYRAGDQFRAVYAIRAGSIKTYTISKEGEEQITGFHFPGEILGLDAISRKHHPSFAKTLETTSLCAIPYERLEELSGLIPGLRHQMFRIMSTEIFADQELLLLLGKKNAQQRIAAFLLNLSARFAQRGLSSEKFMLSMKRSEISNYLGLTLETVSRIFSKLQKNKLIAVKDREVYLLEPEALKQLSGNPCGDVD